MRIIQVGLDPKDQEYQHTCPTCATIFGFYLKDVTVKSDFRDSSMWYQCNCPHCNREQYIFKLKVLENKEK